MKSKVTAIIISILLSLSAQAQWDTDVMSFRGRMALQEGRWAAAIEQFNVLAGLTPDDYWNYFYRGIAKYNLGDIRGAQNDFDKSISLNPVFTNGYHYRAITKSHFGRYDDAFADFQRAIELRPGNIGLYFSRGVTYFLAQRFDEALADFNKYIDKQPDDAAAYLNRGATRLFLKDTLNAISDYDRAIKLDRRESEGYIRRGRVYALQHKYDLATEDMTKAITLDPKSTIAYFTRAMMYYEQLYLNDAMKDFNKVLELDPNNSLTLYNRSLLYAQVGDIPSALADMDEVIRLNPANVLAYYNRATFQANAGNYKEAIKDLDKAIELFPDFAKAYMVRSNIKSMMGRSAAAKEDYQIAKKKIAAYRESGAKGETLYSEDSEEFSSLLSLDSDFSKKEFNEELLQNREVEARLRPLMRFIISDTLEENLAFSTRFENALIDRFIATLGVNVKVSDSIPSKEADRENMDALLSKLTESEQYFIYSLAEMQAKNFNKASQFLDMAVKKADSELKKDRYIRFYKGFYLMNRGVIKAEMAEFLSNMGSSVQTLKMDDKGIAKTKVGDNALSSEDYNAAIEDMLEAVKTIPDIPYVHFNLGNLYVLSRRMVESLDCYSKAISLYPKMGEAYFNRGLVLIMVKDKEKGCIDLSRAGELGVKDAYGIISKYCKSDGGGK